MAILLIRAALVLAAPAGAAGGAPRWRASLGVAVREGRLGGSAGGLTASVAASETDAPRRTLALEAGTA
ncbi:MAG: hypothetical protein LBK72_01180 [Bifidobacteriaceae bacterium]|nr:hypothetical protein [Bifidobacteriaceae bacterium]